MSTRALFYSQIFLYDTNALDAFIGVFRCHYVFSSLSAYACVCVCACIIHKIPLHFLPQSKSNLFINVYVSMGGMEVVCLTSFSNEIYQSSESKD